MKILFMVYAPQRSFEDFAEGHQTKFPWVDALISQLTDTQEITLGLVVPVKEGIFQSRVKDKVSIYGVPDLIFPHSPFSRLFKSRASMPESEILSHTLRAVEDFDPDIIQVFGTENIFGMVQSVMDRPVVIHFQGSVLVVASKWFTGISKWEQARAITLRKLIYRGGSFFEYFAFRRRGLREEIIMQNCRYFIGRTSFDRRIIKLISPQATYFFCDEFLRNEFFEKKWELPVLKSFTCISILKAVTYKGLDLLFSTLDTLQRYTSIELEFKICGVSENEEVVSILKRKHRFGNTIKHFKFLGKLDTNDLIDELISANVFVHPSYMENSPNSICEAMALGMPVIATNAGGTNTLINDDYDGILVQEGDPYSMSAAILEVISNPAKARLIGLNARARAIQRHQPDKLKEDMINIYHSIISLSGTTFS